MSNMTNPNDRKYTASHEWIKLEADGTLTVGITDHAQAALGDMVYIETPKAGRVVKAGEACSVVESVKAASDVYAPVAGEVIEGNSAIANAPELVNKDAFANWLFKLKPANHADYASLLTVADYDKIVSEE